MSYFTKILLFFYFCSVNINKGIPSCRQDKMPFTQVPFHSLLLFVMRAGEVLLGLINLLFYHCIQFPVCGLCLKINQFSVKTVFLHKCLMTALFSDYSICQNYDLVCCFDGSHSMRNNENCLAFDQSGNRILNFGFVVYVKRCCRFIQQDDRCIF